MHVDVGAPAVIGPVLPVQYVAHDLEVVSGAEVRLRDQYHVDLLPLDESLELVPLALKAVNVHLTHLPSSSRVFLHVCDLCLS